MPAKKLTDQIGKTVMISEEMTVLHAVELSGMLFNAPMTVQFLRGSGPGVTVQTKVGRGQARHWELAALVNADFKSGKLDGLKEYAEKAIDADRAVAIFRQQVIQQIPTDWGTSEERTRLNTDNLVTHSMVHRY